MRRSSRSKSENECSRASFPRVAFQVLGVSPCKDSDVGSDVDFRWFCTSPWLDSNDCSSARHGFDVAPHFVRNLLSFLAFLFNGVRDNDTISLGVNWRLKDLTKTCH